mmetsp:Transcript_40145/g.90008  ORF Transcript_40145/g.90008 Transcript_40145/m.90008 type:complete len:480 (+) Transcript_40145:29-1468(+)
MAASQVMEKAGARHGGNGGSDQVQRLLPSARKAQAIRPPNPAAEAKMELDAVASADVSEAEQDVPGQVPVATSSPKGSAQRRQQVLSPARRRKLTPPSPATEPEGTAVAVPITVPFLQKPSPKQSKPERAKVNRDDQQERYQQHLAYLKSLESNTSHAAVDEGGIEAELASMLRGLTDELREKEADLPEVEALDMTATTLAEPEEEHRQTEDSQSETSGAGCWPKGFPAPSTVEDLSQAMDQEVWNKLRQQLQSLECNIHEITEKFAPSKPGTLASPHLPERSPALHERECVLQRQQAHINSGRFQRVSYNQLPATYTPRSSSSNSSMRPPSHTWHLQRQMPNDYIPSNASESSASFAQAGRASGPHSVQSSASQGQQFMSGSQSEDVCRQGNICPALPGCRSQSSASLTSPFPMTPLSAKITFRAFDGVPGTPNAGARSPGRHFAVMRPMTPQAVTPRLASQRRLVAVTAPPSGAYPA